MTSAKHRAAAEQTADARGGIQRTVGASDAQQGAANDDRPSRKKPANNLPGAQDQGGKQGGQKDGPKPSPQPDQQDRDPHHLGVDRSDNKAGT